MPNYLPIKLCVAIVLILSILLAFESTVSAARLKKNSRLLGRARRNFLLREKQYLKANPLSDNLRNFIERARNEERRKREELMKDKEHIRYMKSANESMEESQNEQEDSTESEGHAGAEGGFKGERTVTPFYHEHVPTAIGTEETINDGLTEANMEDEMATSTNRTDPKTLNRLLTDVQGFLKQENGAAQEGALCNLSGDWDSEAGGVMINIELKQSKCLTNAVIKLYQRELRGEGFLTNERWNVTGRIPFVHSSVIQITAWNWKGKKVATFIGECRICDGSETITGDWMIGRASTNCKDQKAAHAFYSDVLRRNNVNKLKLEHLKTLCSTTEDSTGREKILNVNND